MPDTFASKAAAVAEKNADNAIGNVTGSNSVNVFLGLGLPWMIASIVHAAKVRHWCTGRGTVPVTPSTGRGNRIVTPSKFFTLQISCHFESFLGG